eukprot:2255635-Karenia_brevis.AAC.1
MALKQITTGVGRILCITLGTGATRSHDPAFSHAEMAALKHISSDDELTLCLTTIASRKAFDARPTLAKART